MNIQDIQAFLEVVSETLTAIKEFSVFEQATEDDGYYTATDLGIGDAIQSLNEIVEGIENANNIEGALDEPLTEELEDSIHSLNKACIEILGRQNGQN